MKKPTKSDCYGCHDDFYNVDNRGLNGECWHFETAKMERARFVHINTVPPFERIKPELRPNCFHKPQFVRIRLEKKP